MRFVYEDGQLRLWSPGYQRTLGIGRRGNWAHAFQIHPFLYPEDDFVGGRAAYIFAWKPARESPWSTTLILGADRVLGGELVPVEGGAGGREEPGRGREGPGRGAEPHGRREGEGPEGAWRPLVQADLWYTFNERLAVGIENDVFAHHRQGEYLILPHVNWYPIEHVFVQVGAGYYQLGQEREAVFACRVNLINPSPRKTHPALEERRETGEREAEPAGRGGLSRLFGRR